MNPSIESTLNAPNAPTDAPTPRKRGRKVIRRDTDVNVMVWGLHREQLEFFRQLGHGNLSAGIRYAADYLIEHYAPPELKAEL